MSRDFFRRIQAAMSGKIFTNVVKKKCVCVCVCVCVCEGMGGGGSGIGERLG